MVIVRGRDGWVTVTSAGFDGSVGANCRRVLLTFIAVFAAVWATEGREMNEAELNDKELDAAVAKALGYEHHGAVGVFKDDQSGRPWCLSEVNDWWKDAAGKWLCGPCHGFPYAYSSEWERGGPIIERERIELGFMGAEHGWQAAMNPEAQADWALPWHDGPTALIAAMRAFVISKFGDIVPGSTEERRDMGMQSAGLNGVKPNRSNE